MAAITDAPESKSELVLFHPSETANSLSKKLLETKE
jgi:hypothetical protein